VNFGFPLLNASSSTGSHSQKTNATSRRINESANRSSSLKRRLQFRLATLMFAVAVIAGMFVVAQASWRYFCTDMAWRSFPEPGALERTREGSFLYPQYKIRISDNPDLTDQDFSTLAGLSTITHLDVSNTSLTDRCIDDLKSLTNLRSLDISGTKISPQGVKDLHAGLPMCTILHDR
jgi:hypothetical protein